LPPCDPDDAVARGLEDAVAGSVGLEGLLCVVYRAPVELHDDPLRTPQAVDLIPNAFDLDMGVGLGEGQAVLDQKFAEALLELAFRHCDVLSQQCPEGRYSGAPGVAL
jgi:hypothetical protein